eukprot:COSAG04_NODE_1066_length_8488_cov_2.933246_3_plen_178_part_00
MAPNVSLGSAATALCFLVLAGVQLETDIQVDEVLAAPRGQLDEPEPEPLAHHLEGEMQQLRGTVAAQQAVIAERQAFLAELYEVLLEPLEQYKPGQKTPGAGGSTNATNRSSGNATINMTADGVVLSKRRWGDVCNAAGVSFLEQMEQMERMQTEFDDIKEIVRGSGAPDAGHGKMR